MKYNHHRPTSEQPLLKAWNRLSSARIRTLLAVIALLSASGCSLTGIGEQEQAAPMRSVAEGAALDSSESCCASLQQLPYQPLPLDADLRIKLGIESPSYLFPGGASRFLAFSLPINSNSFRIEIQSLAAKTLLQPTVMLLDANFQVTRIIGDDRFKYAPARGFKGDSIDGSFRIDRSYPGNPVNERYLIIYTTATQLAGQTTLVHPAKAYAIAHGNQPPAIADPVMLHSDRGEIKLVVTEEKTSVSEEYVPSRSRQQLMAATSQPALKAAEAVLPQVLPETEAFYRQSVSAAVSAGDLDKALRLVEESQRLGIPEIREHFLSLLQR